jgi:hypothetical protein
MSLTQAPFEFPGNRERLGKLFLPDENALAELLQGGKLVLIVGFGNTVEDFQRNRGDISLHLILSSGQWKLFSNH